MPAVKAPAAFAASGPALSFVVLTPGGLPAVDAVAVARLTEDLRDGVRTAPVYTASADGSGAITLRVPRTDPYIAAHPERRQFNIHIDLFQFSDAVVHKAIAYNAANLVLNFDDPTSTRSFVDLNHSVIQLVAVPQRAKAVAPAVPALANNLPDSDTCRPQPPAHPPVYTCYKVSHPPRIQGVPVVVAHNVGAGLDFKTRLILRATASVGTTTVSGVDGLFVEAKDHHSLSTSIEDEWSYVNSGVSSANEDAALFTNFAQIDSWECWSGADFPDCSHVTDFVPDGVVGTAPLAPTSEPIYHDYAHDPGPNDTDCTTHVSDYYTNSRGMTKEESYTFGFDFEGEYKVFTLHATSVQTRQQTDGATTSYTWSVIGNLRPFHHVFVPFGHLATDADAGSLCPTDAPGSTWTDADWRDKSNPARPYVTPPPQAPEPVKEEAEDTQQRTGRCYEAPERCGRE